MNAFEIVPGTNGSGLESSSLLLFLAVAWCARFCVLLCPLLFELWPQLFLFIWRLLGMVQSRA